MGSGDSILEQLIFNSREHGKIVFHQVEKTGDLLSICGTGKFGTMLLKEVRDEGWSYRFSSFDIAEDMTLRSILYTPYLGILINSGTDVGYRQEGIRSGTLKQHQARMINVPYLYIDSKFFKGRLYTFFDICFTPEHLRPWEKAFRSLSRIRSKAKKGMSSFETFEVTDGGRGIISTITNIQTTAKNTASPHANRTNLMNELLFNLFDLYETRAQSIKLHSTDIDLLNQVHDLLVLSPTTFVSLKQLGHQVGMNEFKLKNGFKKLFGSPVYQFFVAERMKRAKKLLADKKRSVGEVAVMVGYKSLSSFSSAYKKWFGYPPNSAR